MIAKEPLNSFDFSAHSDVRTMVCRLLEAAGIEYHCRMQPDGVNYCPFDQKLPMSADLYFQLKQKLDKSGQDCILEARKIGGWFRPKSYLVSSIRIDHYDWFVCNT